MRRSSAITLWIVLLVLESCLIAPMMLATGFRCRCGSPSYEVVFTADGHQIFTQSDEDQAALNALYEDSSLEEDIHFEWLRVWPISKSGPVDGLIEFYSIRGCLESPNSIHISDIHYDTPQNRKSLFDDMVQVALQDEYLSRFNPGQPRVTSFDIDATIATLIRFIIFFGVPTLITSIVHKIKRRAMRLSADWRIAQGLCVSCAYDCNGLTTPICPECGHNHAQPNSA